MGAATCARPYFSGVWKKQIVPDVRSCPSPLNPDPSFPKRRSWVARFRAKREQLQTVSGLLPEGRGRNLALTVLCVPCSLDRAGGGAVPGSGSGGRAQGRQEGWRGPGWRAQVILTLFVRLGASGWVGLGKWLPSRYLRSMWGGAPMNVGSGEKGAGLRGVCRQIRKAYVRLPG